MSDDPETTVAVIGLGDISAVHLAAISANPRTKLVAVCDTDPGRAERAAESWGVRSFHDHRTLLQAARPDVVHITTPHAQHVPVALDAIGAGVHVLTEKPVAHTVADAERLVEAARNASVKVGVVLQNRYNATSRAIRAIVDSGELGPLVGGRGQVWWSRPPAYYQAAPWRGTLVGQRWRSADQPGDPHAGSAVVVPGRAADGAGLGLDAGDGGHHRGRGHRDDQARTSQRRTVGVLRHERPSHQCRGGTGDQR